MGDSISAPALKFKCTYCLIYNFLHHVVAPERNFFHFWVLVFGGVTVNAPVMNVLINRVVLIICTTIPDCDTCDKLHTLPDFDLGNTDCVVLVTPVCGHAIPDL